ncbi:MAG TPA: hypothetical protein VE326_10785 [Candidatus Binatia bacterium]|nr:hypothetical protein [Candidatus Binatia bacterium]
MPRRVVATVFVLALVSMLLPRSARADRKYFVETYTPYLAPAGELELETWLTSRSGKAEDQGSTAWEWRQEFEYSITNRLTAAAYLNFDQPGGGALRFKAPSLEFIYALADPGRIPGHPALYLETTESGEELELEPKLLLAHRSRRFVGAMNLVGEFEFRHNDEELLEDGTVMRKAWAWRVVGGAAYELSSRVSAGVEGRYVAEYPNFGPRSGSAFSLGPVFNVQAGEVQIGVGVLRQLRGSPHTSGDLNLDEFERTQVRAIIGVEL